MKKITYTILVLTGLFISSTVYALEARIPTTSITQALQIARNKDNFSTLKSAKFDVANKIYNITYLAKDGSVGNVKISKTSGKEVK
tara:strand:- start:429 stop:686 length:258 start_codon:yes stop_codon:yes gene_type:complete